MKIIRQLLNFLLIILLFLSISLLTVVQVSKSVNSDKFIRKTVESKELKREINTGEYELRKTYLVNLGIDYKYHKDINLDNVFETYLFNMVKSKQKEADKFVKVDQDILREAIANSPYEINYRKNYTTDIEKGLNAEFNTIYQSTRAKFLLKLGQINNFEWMLLGAITLEILLLFLLRTKYSNIIKAILFSSIINLVLYIALYFLLKIPVYTGKFLAIYLNLFIKNLSNLVFQTSIAHIIVTISAIVALIVGLSYEKRYAKKKGIKTLDNFFDDYNVDKVLEEFKSNKKNTKITNKEEK